MLWLMNTFNKSSSYLIQVLTVTLSVLPSSTVFSVWCENGGKDCFSAAKMGVAKIAAHFARHFVPSTPLNLKFWIHPCSLHIGETPGLLSCCKKLSPIDRHLLSPSLKWQKPVVSGKVRFKMLSSYCPSTRLFEVTNDRASQDL